MIRDDDDEDELLVDPLNSLLSQVGVGGGPPPGINPPSMGFMPSSGVVAEPVPTPEATRENFVCLRDCRHYYETVNFLPVANDLSSLGGRMPKQVVRVCRLSDIDITESTVFRCSSWDPNTTEELVQIADRRKSWSDAHPDVVPFDPYKLVEA